MIIISTTKKIKVRKRNVYSMKVYTGARARASVCAWKKRVYRTVHNRTSEPDRGVINYRGPPPPPPPPPLPPQPPPLPPPPPLFHYSPPLCAITGTARKQEQQSVTTNNTRPQRLVRRSLVVFGIFFPI